MAEILINFDDALIQFTAVGGETGFAYDFPIFDKTHLVVLRQATATADPVTMLEGTGYTVAGVGDEAGGSITLVTPATATLDEVYTLFRDVPEQRITDFTQSGSFTAININRELDLMAMQLQQLRRDVDRSARMDQFDQGVPADMLLPVKVSRASLFAAWDAAGKWIAATTITTSPVTAFMATMLDDPTQATARATLGLDTGDTVQFNKLGLGLPVPDGSLHIQVSSIGAVTAAAAGDDFVIEGSGALTRGMSILTDDGQTGVILFGDASDQDIGAVQYDHNIDALEFVTNNAVNMTLTSIGALKLLKQPAFLAFNTADDLNITGNGVNITVEFNSEIYDQNDDYNIVNDSFTAPTPGRYQLNTGVQVGGLVSATEIDLVIGTSNRSYQVKFSNPPDGIFTAQLAVIADMDGADTVTIRTRVTGMAGNTADILGNVATFETHFSGCLLA